MHDLGPLSRRMRMRVVNHVAVRVVVAVSVITAAVAAATAAACAAAFAFVHRRVVCRGSCAVMLLATILRGLRGPLRF